MIQSDLLPKGARCLGECFDDAHPACGKCNPAKRLLCTRPAGHEGPHQACETGGSEPHKPVVQWEDRTNEGVKP